MTEHSQQQKVNEELPLRAQAKTEMLPSELLDDILGLTRDFPGMMVPLPAYDIVPPANAEEDSCFISLRQRELSHDFGISLRSSSEDCDGKLTATESLIPPKSAEGKHTSMNRFQTGRFTVSQYQSVKSFHYIDDMQEKEKSVSLMMTSNSIVRDQPVDNKPALLQDDDNSTLSNPVNPFAFNTTSTRKFNNLDHTSFEHKHLPPRNRCATPISRHRRNSVRRKRSSLGKVRPSSEGKGPPVNNETLKALQRKCQSDVIQNRGSTDGSTSSSSRLQYQTSLPNLPEFITDLRF